MKGVIYLLISFGIYSHDLLTPVVRPSIARTWTWSTIDCAASALHRTASAIWATRCG